MSRQRPRQILGMLVENNRVVGARFLGGELGAGFAGEKKRSGP